MNVSELMEQRDAQWAAALAGGRATIEALRQSYVEAGWKSCPHPTCPPFDCRAEKVATDALDALECPCGNATHLDGFDPCTPAGALCEPDEEWTGHVRCATCGRIYDTSGYDGRTVTVVCGPDLFCRWCGRGARLVVHPEDGKVARCEGGGEGAGECPVKSVPGWTNHNEGRHSIIGVVRSACVNPLHAHDAITDPDGGSDPVTNLCNDEAGPMHYDDSQGWYFHDDPDPVHACFLSGPNVENPCYTEQPK